MRMEMEYYQQDKKKEMAANQNQVTKTMNLMIINQNVKNLNLKMN